MFIRFFSLALFFSFLNAASPFQGARTPFSEFLSPLSQLLSIPSFVVSDDKKAELTYWMGDDVSKLETAIGSGFSGGPLVQNGGVVGLVSGGSLETIFLKRAFIKRLSLPAYVGSLMMYGGSLALSNSSLQYWVQMGAFVLGFDSWLLSFVFQPALSYGMGIVINNNVMTAVCSISSAAIYVSSSLKNYQWSTYAKITPNLLEWMREQLKPPSKEVVVEVSEDLAVTT